MSIGPVTRDTRQAVRSLVSAARQTLTADRRLRLAQAALQAYGLARDYDPEFELPPATLEWLREAVKTGG